MHTFISPYLDFDMSQNHDLTVVRLDWIDDGIVAITYDARSDEYWVYFSEPVVLETGEIARKMFDKYGVPYYE